VLAATWPEPGGCLLVEADPFGGVIAARYGLGDSPGLSTLAATARGGFDDDAVEAHTQRLPGGLAVLVGPASPEEARAVWRDVSGPLTTWAATRINLAVVIDGGRIQPANGVPDGGPALVVTRPSVDQLRPAGIRQAALAAAGSDASLLLVGDRPYGADEVAATMQVPVAGVVAWDPRTAEVLTGAQGVIRDLRRSLLVRSVATLAERLAADLDGGGRVDSVSRELARGVGR
jgi:hypothetical protein